MSRYYYFAATLPTLQLGAPAPMTSAEYLERARRHLEPAEYAALEAATLASAAEGPPPEASADPLLGAYYAWERSVRNELARLRAKRLGRAAEPHLRPAERDEGAQAAAQRAFAAETPLEGELVLERERWARLEELAALKTFDFARLAAYRLELEVLERIARLGAERGEAGYRETYAAILGQAQTSEETGVSR